MQQVEPQTSDPIGPLDWLKLLPFKPDASRNTSPLLGVESPP
jgi:hypothetical protein